MARLLIILGVAAVVFWIFSIVDCAVQPETRHRGVSKAAWMLIVILLPVLGGVLWFVIGRTRPGAQPAGPIAPDDDPAFLGRIGTISDQDERIRQIEEELARLDAEETSDDAPRADEETHRDDAPDGDDDARGSHGARG